MNQLESSQRTLGRAPRGMMLLALVCGVLALSSLPAAAQVTYQYSGNPFNLFSCGGNSDCSIPGPNANTSYTATDHVTGTLTLNAALPPNLAAQDISTLPGFQISLNDGHQTMTATAGYTGGFIATVSTDANSNITGWVFVVNCCFYPNNGIATANNPGGNGVFDQGTLSAPSANNGYPNTPYNLALNFNAPGSWGSGLSGTATRTIITGEAFGTPITPQDVISGGDGKLNTTFWNFSIPSGWSYARGAITKSGLEAGAYSATSGPVRTYGIGAGRGIAYRSFSNNSNSTLSFQVNAVLDGEFEYMGGVASAGVYIFDATAFANAIASSGQATPQFLLNSSTLSSLAGGGSSLAALVPSSGVLLNVFQNVSGPANQLLTLPLVTGFATVQPQQAITLVFDVSAYAPAYGWSNFASTLAPSPTLPLFTDASGNAVTQMVALGPSLSASAVPASLVLTPATASIPAGTSGSITATVTDSNSSPVPNAIVFFSFNSGPNAGAAGPISTDANGQAVFSYTDNGGAGTDVIQATVGSLIATPVSINWTAPGPLDHIVVSPAAATITVGAGQTYSAAAFDRFNNRIGDVTSQTIFSISPDGACAGATCTPSATGTHTVSGSYSGKTAQATLNVSGAILPLTISASSASMTYGGTVPVITPSYTYGSVVNAATPPSGLTTPPTCSTTATSSSPVGAYPSTCSGAAAANYTISYTAGSVTVSAAPLTITAGSASMTFGGIVPTITPSYTYGGVVNSATPPSGLTTPPTCSTTATSSSPASTYPTTCAGAVDSNYTISYVGGVLTISNPTGKTNPVITWPTPGAITFGTPLSSIQLDATANVPGTFAYTPKAGTILTGGTHTLTVTFTPTNTSAYNNGTASVTLTVNKATPAILWVPFPITYGTPLGPLQLDAVTLVPGKFVYTPAAGAVLPAGQQTLSATFTPNDSTDFLTVTPQATLLVLKATPVISWPPPAAITVGTPLSATQLNAKANVPGTFVYNPPAGTKLPVGMAELNATFTPTDSTDYKSGQGEVTITVKSH